MRLDIAGRVLRSNAVAALASPHSVDRYLEQINPMWAAHEARARIVDVTREVDVPGSAPVATITLQPTSTWRGHRAGQHVQIGVDVDGGKRLQRVFTVSSADSRPGDRFTLTLRANEDAPGRPSVSRFLVERARPGTVVHLSQAMGDFVLPDAVPEHVIFISGGSGITPVMSMLRSLQRRTHRGRVTFVHYARSPAHQIFADELAEAAAGGYGLDVHLLHPELGDPALSPEYLQELVPGYRDVPTWACGPAPLMAAVQAAWDGSDALRTEFFQPPRSSGTAGGDVSFSRTGAEVPNNGATLLEQAEAAGLTPEFGCRMGICFGCVAKKPSGTVRNVLTGETSDAPDDDIRICVSAPEGDCTVEL